ncbi:MAG: bacillithiol biosynthesis cysteine-adding enzyme BshC, partial [Flavobacteriaceae bacterium]
GIIHGGVGKASFDEAQIVEKQANFPAPHRKVLYKALEEQYQDLDASKKTKEHIRQLQEANSFTVVTGHQLNLFTGPLYFLYKIISAINLTSELKKAYPDFNFVPVYWMATEDHDFDEINYFNFKGKKFQWNIEAAGAVGRLSTEGLDAVLERLSIELGKSKNAQYLLDLFRRSYLANDNLSAATRYLANELFGEYGLVIIDGDHKTLKGLLVPYAKQDIFENSAAIQVEQSIDKLQELPANYGIQVNPREINYFYLRDGIRERIVKEDERYYAVNTDFSFTRSELQSELEEYPERFSPNVVARPLYQEVILPNLCYIGGGGELAYWLELKASFKAMEVAFPILLLRNSALLISRKQYEKLEKLGIKVDHLFLKQNSLINKKIREISNIDINFSPQKKHLEQQFEALYQMAEATDKSFFGAVKAQEVKQKKGLDHLEKRLLKAQKRKLKDQVVRMTDIQNELFPGQSLQERHLNFSEMYLELGENLIPQLIEALQPLQSEFFVVKY